MISKQTKTKCLEWGAALLILAFQLGCFYLLIVCAQAFFIGLDVMRGG
jgi:hypothetical protein